MDKEKFIKGIRNIQGLAMKESERALLYERIEREINTIPKNISKAKSPYSFYSNFFFSHAGTVLAPLIVIFIAGSNAFYISNNSLPGDRFYPLKVSVIEPLKYSLASNDFSRAQLEVENFDNRLIEAEVLELQGKLSDSLQNEIEIRIKKHSDNFNAILSDSDMSDVKNDFDAKINAHFRIIEDIENTSNNKNSGSSKRIKENLINLSYGNSGQNEKVVAPKAMMATMASDSNESSVAFNNAEDNRPSQSKEVFLKKKKEVERIIKNVKNNLNKIRKKNIQNNFILNAQSLIEESDILLTDSIKEYELGNIDNSIFLISESRKKAKEADTSVKFAKEVGKKTKDD